MKTSLYFTIIFLGTLIPAFAQNATPNIADVMAKLQQQLNLSQRQVHDVTPVIAKYQLAFQQLQQSVDQNTTNESSVKSQWQSLEAEETQEVSQYLNSTQLAAWPQLQASTEPQGSAYNADSYSNMPYNPASQ